MKIILLKILFFFTISINYGQSIDNLQNFRFPPEVKLKNKMNKSVDLSYKLTNKNKPHDYDNVKNSFHTKYNLNKLEKYKNDIDTYNYLKKVADFFNSIKPEYKKLYNEMELWYIYIYDINLCNKLIK